MISKTSGYISTGDQELHYISFGVGSKLLFAFHGYGDSAAFFLPFAEYLQKEYTIISFDLPHHGNCQWPDDKYLEVDALMAAIHSFKDEYKVDKISLAGYSIGGRICLKIMELEPGTIDKVVLMASDGLVFNPLYYFVTKNFIGTKLFKGFLSRPEPYMRWIEFAKKNNWLSEARYKLAAKYLHSEDSRNFLWKVWPCLSLIVPDINKLKKAITANSIPIHIFMGKHDPVIPLAHAEIFCKGLETAQLHVLDKAHRLLDAESIPQIAAALL
jgi:pimeloyl-ACP methyl ester carboxylesterase